LLELTKTTMANSQLQARFDKMYDGLASLIVILQCKHERNSNQARALLGRSNIGTNGPTDQWTNGPTDQPTDVPTDERMKSLIEALCSRLKIVSLYLCTKATKWSSQPTIYVYNHIHFSFQKAFHKHNGGFRLQPR
jgi:hypothetical protein